MGMAIMLCPLMTVDVAIVVTVLFLVQDCGEKKKKKNLIHLI